MAGSQTKAIALVLLLIFMDVSTGQAMGVAQAMNYSSPQNEAINTSMKKMRKLIEIDLLDYQKEGPNNKHKPPNSGN